MRLDVSKLVGGIYPEAGFFTVVCPKRGCSFVEPLQLNKTKRPGPARAGSAYHEKYL
jgi:hypothetical protein